MGRNHLLKEKARFEKRVAYVVELYVLVGFVLTWLAQMFLVQKPAAIIMAVYYATVFTGLFLSRYDKVKNAFVVVLSVIMCLVVIGLSSPFVFLMHGLSGVKKYWKFQLKYYIKVLMAR